MAFDPNEPYPETLANFALMTAEPGAMLRYWRLAVETSNYTKLLRDEGKLSPGSSWFHVDQSQFVNLVLVETLPESVSFIARWSAWDNEYRQIYEHSPNWRLKEMVSQISETHHCLSWPNRWERDIWDWASSDLSGEVCPFDDRRNVIDSKFHKRIQDLVVQCDGFLYRCEESGQIVFAPTEHLPRIWRHQDHIAQIERQKPFGFFHDLSRPNWREFARELTDVEERMMRASRRPTGWRDWLRQLRSRLRKAF